MLGTLFLCATPIGNMEDITIRAINTLKEVDFIACEDTRVSAKLLSRYDIHTKTTAYHEHNKKSKGEKLMELLKDGKNIALITDAGMPGISDPGEDMVKLCLDEGIPVTVLPGASAGISALAQSGISARRFVFEGFLPTKNKERKAILKEISKETRTVILYEAPHRLKTTLIELYDALGERNIFIARELTKKFEDKERTTLSEAIENAEKKEPRGEYVIVLEGCSKEKLQQDSIEKWNSTSLSNHMEYYEKQGMERKDAMKAVAKDRGVSKREIYDLLKND